MILIGNVENFSYIETYTIVYTIFYKITC